MSFGSFPTRYETVGYLKSSVFSKIGWAAVDVVSGEFVNSTVDISMKGPYGLNLKGIMGWRDKREENWEAHGGIIIQ